uniref:PB1 domain-containing protein n=1 Tax=Angiostrongylus cantonensis TaxID=6313 RepID=A0A0K0D8K5_ANGCA
MGIYVVDDQENILLEFSYPEVTRILHHECGRPGVDMCTLQMASGDEYSFQSSSANDIKALLTTFFNGLKERSLYLVAIKSQQRDDSNDLLEFETGDLLTLVNGLRGKDLLDKISVKVRRF